MFPRCIFRQNEGKEAEMILLEPCMEIDVSCKCDACTNGNNRINKSFHKQCDAKIHLATIHWLMKPLENIRRLILCQKMNHSINNPVHIAQVYNPIILRALLSAVYTRWDRAQYMVKQWTRQARISKCYNVMVCGYMLMAHHYIINGFINEAKEIVKRFEDRMRVNNTPFYRNYPLQNKEDVRLVTRMGRSFYLLRIWCDFLTGGNILNNKSNVTLLYKLNRAYTPCLLRAERIAALWNKYAKYKKSKINLVSSDGKIKPEWEDEIMKDWIYISVYSDGIKLVSNILREPSIMMLNENERYLYNVAARKECDVCGIQSLQLYKCEGCNQSWYCGISCQKLDWKRKHKVICDLVQNESDIFKIQFRDSIRRDRLRYITSI